MLFVTEDTMVAAGLWWRRIGDLRQGHLVWAWDGNQFEPVPLRTSPARSYRKALVSKHPVLEGRVSVRLPDENDDIGRNRLRVPCTLFRGCCVWVKVDEGVYGRVPVPWGHSAGKPLLTFRNHMVNVRRDWPFHRMVKRGSVARSMEGRREVVPERVGRLPSFRLPPGWLPDEDKAFPVLEKREYPRPAKPALFGAQLVPGSPLTTSNGRVSYNGSLVLESATGLVLESGVVLDPAVKPDRVYRSNIWQTRSRRPATRSRSRRP